MLRLARVMVALAFPLILLGCRIVWIHPEATAEKYQADTLRCKYGMTPAEFQQAVDTANGQIPPYRRNWRECMQMLGWKTKTDSRDHRPWDVGQ